VDPDFGRFPFGQPNSVRPTRRAIPARTLVIGAYPSAFHVSWTAPRFAHGGEGTGRVRALAVDVEPEVFWQGNEAGGAELLEAWLKEVDFQEGDEPGQHGHIDSRLPAANGSSGRKLLERYLQPLGLKPDEVTFTDIYPVFMVKSGAPGKRDLGDAIRIEYNSIAEQMGREPSHLPGRISPATLPLRAAKEFGDRMRKDLLDASPELVITLGEEAWQTVNIVFGLDAHSPVSYFEALHGEAYGRPGTIRSGSHVAKWLPLVHPGLLRNNDPANGKQYPAKRSVSGWNQVHSRWEEKNIRNRI